MSMHALRSCVGALVASTLVTMLWSCTSGEPAPTPDVVVGTVESLPTEPADPAWRKVPVHVSDLLLQDMVEPRLLEASTTTVRVRALTDGRAIAFLLEWDDARVDDLPSAARFSDACAVQLARDGGPDLPAPQMGEADRAVEIALWRASWQAVVDGRGDTIRDIHPHATVDHYPFEAESLEDDGPQQRQMELRYAPARALGNPMAGPRTRPTQALLAEGPGTLGPDPTLEVEGRGHWEQGRWSVVISRPVPPDLDAGSNVAFAVWEGGHGEAGARKMRSVWVALHRRAS